MAHQKPLNILLLFCTSFLSGFGYTQIEPPVKSEKKSQAEKTIFEIQNTVSLESNLRWRNVNQNSNQPGIANYSTAAIQYYKLKSFFDFNLFNSGSDLSNEDTAISLTHLMSETKMGMQYPLGFIRCSPILWSISKVI